MPPLAIIACGGTDHSDAQFVYDELSLIDYERGGIHLLIEGGAVGADRQASNWAYANKVPHRRFKADWNSYSKLAGPIRNREMLDFLLDLQLRSELCWRTLVVAFPSKRMAEGRGDTLDMSIIARAAGIEVLTPTKEPSHAI